MTLKEKFQEEPVVIYQEDSKLTNQSAEKCEQIADYFATEFGKWLNNKVINRNGIHHHLLGVLKVDNLLEIYKKEKGL